VRDFDAILNERTRLEARRADLYLARARGAAMLAIELLRVSRKKPNKRVRDGLAALASALPDSWDRAHAYERIALSIYAQVTDFGGEGSWVADLALRPWIARADARREDLAREIRWRDVELSRLAGSTQLRAGEGRSVMHTVSRSTYASQGYGADTYARNAAESYREERESCLTDDERAAGIRVVVERGEVTKNYPGIPASPSEYVVVLVGVSGTRDGQILRRRRDTRTLVDWVAACWRRGVNPRVYNPFLPHGFEERHGIN